MKTNKTSYKIGQSLPPRHWYQRRVGWFGKSVLSIIAVAGISFGGYTKYLERVDAVRASQSERASQLQKVSQPITASQENIVDVQSVLDTWQEQRRGQQWYVSVRSIDGPTFSAQINGGKTYSAASASNFLTAAAIANEYPAEQHKNIKLDDGKSMQVCLNLMIRLSDGSCKSQLSGYIDYSKVAGFLGSLGVKQTDFSPQRATTTTDDMATLLSAVRGDSFSGAARKSLLTALSQQSMRRGIPAACPGCTIANTGDEDTPVTDSAIIEYAGGSYVLSVYTSGGTITDVAQLAARLQQKILDTREQ